MKANYNKPKKLTQADFQTIINGFYSGTLTDDEKAFFSAYLHQFNESPDFLKLSENARLICLQIENDLINQGFSPVSHKTDSEVYDEII